MDLPSGTWTGNRNRNRCRQQHVLHLEMRSTQCRSHLHRQRMGCSRFVRSFFDDLHIFCHSSEFYRNGVISS
jgi:hypothetical protein